MIPEALRKNLQERVRHAFSPREAAVDVMKELQNHFGWLTDEGLDVAAQVLGLSRLQVEELATFYEMIFRRPVGQQVVHVCDSISCWAMGGETLMQHLERLLGLKMGETTADGRMTLLPCSCLGNCGDAPSVMVGEKLFSNVSPEKALQLIEELSGQKGGVR